jgi:hypothetical protein
LAGGFIADTAFGRDDVGQPKDLFFPDQRLEGPVRVRVGDEEMEGVASQVEGGDAHVFRL